MKSYLAAKIAGLVIRHGMTAIGGAAMAKGFGDAATWQTIHDGAVAAGGVGVTALGLWLSGAEKLKFPRF